MDWVEAAGRALTLISRANQGVAEVIANKEINARIAKVETHLGAQGVDPFGFDPDFIKRFIGVGVWLYRYYFRVQCSGIHHVPKGPCLVVANHSGQLPYDGLMLGMAMFLECEPPRAARSMVERFVPNTPFVSPMLSRFGQVLGTPQNCRRLLAQGEIIQVFPEGVNGLNKTFKQRYQLQRFGHGFMRLAIEMRVPIIPAIVLGAEEQAPSLANLRGLSRLLGLPALPVAPFFGVLPLPTRYRLHFGAPLRFAGDANDEDEAIAQRVQKVKTIMQEMIHEGLKAREHVFW